MDATQAKTALRATCVEVKLPSGIEVTLDTMFDNELPRHADADAAFAHMDAALRKLAETVGAG